MVGNNAGMSNFRNPSQPDRNGRWTYSWILGAGYLLAFSAMTFHHPNSLEVGCIFGGLLSILVIQAWRSGYFLNPWDAFWHGAVVLDVFLEAILIPSHDNWGFLLCWLAFGFVIAGYRSHQLKIRNFY
jgi:hypothetical protein